jgi:hypothetical protein
MEVNDKVNISRGLQSLFSGSPRWRVAPHAVTPLQQTRSASLFTHILLGTVSPSALPFHLCCSLAPITRDHPHVKKRCIISICIFQLPLPSRIDRPVCSLHIPISVSSPVLISSSASSLPAIMHILHLLSSIQEARSRSFLASSPHSH